jgi:drug/metabolite transporter superfamily protein YnfA
LVEKEPKSPYYDYIGGIFLVEIIIFLLGILATRAEPALGVLGRTVEALSGGVFTCKILIWAVSLGVR